jgi:hypothetical protein
LGGDIDTEINLFEDPLIRNMPSLNQVAVTYFPANSVGLTFRFKVKVITTQHQALSRVAFATLASVPFKPTDSPQATSVSASSISVMFSDPQPDNGGSPIISYELVMDDGMSGAFVTLVGLKTNSMLTEFTVSSGIVKGRKHRFMYRARNMVGWGPYSDASFILAA